VVGALLVTVLAVSVGCNSSSTEGFHVSGQVTFNGQPVPRGTIIFEPDTSQGNSGTAGYADIVDGAYNTAETGKGTPGGAMVLRINGFDGNAKPEAELPYGQLLFQDFQMPASLPKEPNAKFDVTIDPGQLRPQAAGPVGP
jgi:hypothetical protein